MAVVALAWYLTIAAGERAERLARGICAEQGLQLLDDSVALVRTRPRLDRRQGPVMERTYLFAYSEDGVGRAQGCLVLRGRKLDHVLLAAERGGSAAG